MDQTHRVVIVGGGFAGLEAAKALGGKREVSVTLIDRRNYHLFQPLLYQVATGGLSPADICAPLRAVLNRYKNVRTLLAEVSGFDLANRKVLLTDGEVPFDTLIVAAGAKHHYFGNDSWAPFAPGLKTIEDATEIRSRVLLAFEAAEREADQEKRRALLTFVIVGGGPTGVELAGTLGEIAQDTLREDFRNFRPEEARILLFNSGDRILSTFDPQLSFAAEKALLNLGVRCRNGIRVTGVDTNGVSFKVDGVEQHLDAETVLWAAGVTANPLAQNLCQAAGLTPDKGGRVVVSPDCSLPGFPHVYALGDMAAMTGKDGQPLPGVAQVAMQGGQHVARQILAKLRQGAAYQPQPYIYWDKGNMATIGRHSAVAEVFGLKCSGTLAWLLWLFIHLMYLVGFQNRLQVFVHWAFQYLTFNRQARLITRPVDFRPPPGR